MTYRYQIIMEYDGAEFCGWQRQAHGRSIQGVLEQALQPLNGGQPPTVIGAGRTDSGVHALAQVAHFDLLTERDAQVVQRALNATTPDALQVLLCRRVPPTFHARFDARRRYYAYVIRRQRAVHRRHTCWTPAFDLDPQLLAECAALLPGRHDFTCFCSRRDSARTKLCNIVQADWTLAPDEYRFHIAANRFLHSMVRMLVGTMTEVARGRGTPAQFKNMLDNQTPALQVYTAPARGLFLLKIDYDEEAT